MKAHQHGKRIVVIIAVAMLAVSCTKRGNIILPVPGKTGSQEVQFILYTTKNFSNDVSGITFTASIKSGTQTLWDSVLTPMQVKDIPAYKERIVFTKTIQATEGTTLSAGFNYYLTGVGTSWYYESCLAGSPAKTVSFNFQ